MLEMSAASSNDRLVMMVIAALVATTIGIGCIALAVLYMHLKKKRQQLIASIERDATVASPRGSDRGDGFLQVIVLANDQEAELEIQPSAFDTYEDLRELVVDAVPQMFNDTDAILIEYADGRGWSRVKTKTPVNVVKNARSVRIISQDEKMSRKIARRLKKATMTSKHGGFQRLNSEEV